MSEFDRLEKQAKILKERYKPGMRIELIHMGSDPQPIPDGTRGTVVGVDDIGSIMMKWDNNRSLSLIYGEDNFRVLTPEEAYAERYEKLNRQFLEKLNSDVFSKVNLGELKKSYDAGDMYYPRMILKAMVLNGACLTAQISVSRNKEGGCILSDILIKDCPAKYFLSKRATERLLSRSSPANKPKESTPQTEQAPV